VAYIITRGWLSCDSDL